MENIARKERRRLEQTKRFRKAKRGAAIVGTAMVGCSVAAPLVQPVPVQADETPVQFGARINTAAFITEIATYAQPIAHDRTSSCRKWLGQYCVIASTLL